MDRFSLVFVCTGNICRSPMAEGIMKDLIIGEVESKGKALPIKVTSAGTNAIDGIAASEYAVSVCAKNNIDIGLHRSKYLCDAITREADLILTMEERHKNIINQTLPGIECLFDLKSFMRRNDDKIGNIGIMDPIGMSINVYENVFNEIKVEILRVKQEIFKLAEEKYS